MTPIAWSAGVPRAAWPTHVFTGEHGDAITRQVDRERSGQGLPKRARMTIRQGSDG